MAQAVTVDTAIEDVPLTAIPEDQESPWRPGKNRAGPRSKRFGNQEASTEERQAFMERTASFSSDDWQRTLLYVYQWAPSVDLTRGGRDPKYRKIFTRHMSEEDLKRDLGSGTYELKLNQINPKGQEKTIDRLVINIYDPDFPPNIPPGPWLDDPKNSDWLWAKPLLEAKYKKAPTPAPNGNGPTWSEMIQFMREERRPDQPTTKDQLMTSVVSILPALLQQQNNAQDPSKLIEAMARVKEMITSPPPPAQDNALMTFVLAQLTRLQESNDKLVQALLTQKAEATKQPDPLSQVETMAKLISTVSGIVQPAAPKEPWQEVVADLGPKALEVADRWAQTITMRNMMNGRKPAPQTQPRSFQPNPVAIVPQQPNPQPQAVPQVTSDQPPPKTAEPAPPEEPGMDTGQRSTLFQIAVLSANALNLGMDGFQFADQICYKFGQAVYDQFIASVPKDGLVQMFRQIPEAWQVLAPYETMLPTFIEAFYAYALEEEEDQTKPISPESVKPKKTGKKK